MYILPIWEMYGKWEWHIFKCSFILSHYILTSRSRMSLPYICRFSKTLAIVDIEYLDKLGTWCGLVDDISPHFLLVIMNFLCDGLHIRFRIRALSFQKFQIVSFYGYIYTRFFPNDCLNWCEVNLERKPVSSQ